jgi:hypothetical protein
LEQFQRARLVSFAYQEAARTGSLPAMKAVCYVIKNRVRAGWNDGNWLSVIEDADRTAGNDPEPYLPIAGNDRNFQNLMRDVEDIYYAVIEDDVSRVVGSSLFFQSIDRPSRQWFVDNIVGNPASHRRVTHIGSLVFFD